MNQKLTFAQLSLKAIAFLRESVLQDSSSLPPSVSGNKILGKNKNCFGLCQSLKFLEINIHLSSGCVQKEKVFGGKSKKVEKIATMLYFSSTWVTWRRRKLPDRIVSERGSNETHKEIIAWAQEQDILLFKNINKQNCSKIPNFSSSTFFNQMICY